MANNPTLNPFGQLNETRWRDVSFPIISTRLILRQDLVQHKFVRIDGADVESTGRAPFEITCQIPFYNHIAPGPREFWSRGTLYPKQWRRFLSAMSDGTTGVFNHPELGEINAKPEHVDTDWTFSTRGGVLVNASWIETTDDPTRLASLIAAVSPLASAIQAAADIDKNLPNITPALPTNPPTFAPTFEDSMRSLQGVFDQTTLLSRRFTGQIDNVLYRVSALENSMELAANAPGAAKQHVLNWPMNDAIQRMKSAANDLKTQLIQGNKKIGIYLNPGSLTMGGVSAAIPAPITDLMRLNPGLLANPIVPPNSKIRYFL